MLYHFFYTLYDTFGNLFKGLSITWRHIRNSLQSHITSPALSAKDVSFSNETLRYPHEKLPVPARGRYKLHNEIDDCIVCNKCAQVCPVDCIDIEAIKSPVVLGKTSNGMTKRLHAARFDIDMAQCCFCGLCTTVCPTQCLTTTAEYDYSVFDWAEHKVSFATMTPQEITEARQQACAS